MTYRNEQEERIGEFLIRMGILTPKQVEDILFFQRITPNLRFGEIGIEKGYLQRRDVRRYLASIKN